MPIWSSKSSKKKQSLTFNFQVWWTVGQKVGRNCDHYEAAGLSGVQSQSKTRSYNKKEDLRSWNSGSNHWVSKVSCDTWLQVAVSSRTSFIHVIAYWKAIIQLYITRSSYYNMQTYRLIAIPNCTNVPTSYIRSIAKNFSVGIGIHNSLSFQALNLKTIY